MYPHLRVIVDRLERVASGEIKRLLINAPPRHGKSQITSQFFPPWYLGLHPDRRIILSTYESGLAEDWGRKCRDVLAEVGSDIYGVRLREDTTAAGRWDVTACGADGQWRNQSGGMIAVGAGSALSGRGCEIGILDDALKNAAEAFSQSRRDHIWDWWESTFCTRLQKDGAIVINMTRWHEDDLCGRILAEAKRTGQKWEVLKFPAIAEEDEEYRDGQGNVIWTRKKGEPLCPELIPLHQLQDRMANDYWWSALWQQRPIRRGAGMFDGDKLWERRLPARPSEIERVVRAWDMAATSETGSARTAGVLLAKLKDGRYVILHVVVGKWRSDERNKMIVQTAAADGRQVPIVFEQEGGSSGKDQAMGITRMLAGWVVNGRPATGDKALRADAYSAQVNAGNVYVVDDGTWDVHDYVAECNAFPDGKLKDQVDASAHAFNWLSENETEVTRITTTGILGSSPLAQTSSSRYFPGHKRIF